MSTRRVPFAGRYRLAAGVAIALLLGGCDSDPAAPPAPTPPAEDLRIDPGAHPCAASGEWLAGRAPQFALPDLNSSSLTYGVPISPGQFRGSISAWYFGHST